MKRNINNNVTTLNSQKHTVIILYINLMSKKKKTTYRAIHDPSSR